MKGRKELVKSNKCQIATLFTSRGILKLYLTTKGCYYIWQLKEFEATLLYSQVLGDEWLCEFETGIESC